MEFWKKQNWKIKPQFYPGRFKKSKFSREKFFYEKASYLKNGMSMLEALELTEEKVDLVIKSSLLTGKSLSLALEETQLFLSKEICLIRLSEETGDLYGAFFNLYLQAKEEREMKGKMFTLLLYPFLLLCSALLFLLVAIYFIAPPISAMLLSLNVESKLLTSLTLFSQKVPFPWMVLLFLGVFRAGMKKALEPGRIHQIILGQKNGLFRELQFIEQFFTLNQGGMNLVHIFEVLSKEGYETLGLQKSIEEGLTMEQAFQKENYSSLLVRYFKLAGETGNYDEALASYLAIQRLYFKDLLAKKTALIEPISILVMGIIVFIVSFLIMMPLLSAYETL